MGKRAFIFPAFSEKLQKKDIIFIEKNAESIGGRIRAVNSKYDYHIAFDIVDNYTSVTENELYSQIVSYIVSVSYAENLSKDVGRCDYTAGYSMGLYAALYISGVIGFDDGISLIVRAFNLIADEFSDKNFAMGVIIGLKLKDIEKLISGQSNNCEIINQNTPYSFVLCGSNDEIDHICEAATIEGALNAIKLPVKSPYHSKYIIRSKNLFREFINNNITIHKGKTPLVSSVNGSVIINPSEIIDELTNNLSRSINWYNSFRKLLSLGVNEFHECGIGNSLQKIGRLIDGDFKFMK